MEMETEEMTSRTARVMQGEPMSENNSAGDVLRAGGLPGMLKSLGSSLRLHSQERQCCG